MIMQPNSKKLLDRVRDAIRLKHYSIRTEEAYVNWIKRYILFHNKRHPNEMGRAEIEAFLTHLAVNKHVAASTQNQALSALLFLYREVLRKDPDFPIDSVRAKRPRRLPTVVTPLREHLQRVKMLHQEDRTKGYGAVYLPYALERKYPNANREWCWQYVFPAKRISKDPRTEAMRRHHVSESSLQKAVRKAAAKGSIQTDVVSSCFPAAVVTHPYAGHNLRIAVNVQRI